ncbi:MAG TPA: hydrogenase 2 operon protein HybA [Candidatus Polarisedimenticolia bacterium]|nr:hydrogenase 2 operon protein HybA [Candidatus Polarisedimenticolia bacterium]
MSVERREVLKLLAIAGAGAGAAVAAPGAAQASEKPTAPPDAMGMLFDTTLCIGCKACVVACHEANDLRPEAGPWAEGLYDAPADLTGQTKNIIKLYKEGDRQSYMKSQCMHCLDPGCVGACMLGALQKREHGIVTWEASKCVGCRYCQMACPYNVPKFEWLARNPRIVKCELCNHRLAEGKIPACCEVCPRQAVIYGRRDDLLAEARRRLAEMPDTYVPKVYGEHDGGGTQVLYLSHVPFEKLGLPDLGEESASGLSRTVQHGIYRGFIAPVALYGLLGAVILRNRRAERAAEGAASGPEEESR